MTLARAGGTTEPSDNYFGPRLSVFLAASNYASFAATCQLMAEGTAFLIPLTPVVLSVLFALTGAGLMIAALWTPQPTLCVKMTGGSLVLALAFAANQTTIYGISMFIVATLVTELEFLEKIAAIFSRNDAYFKWRMASASPNEIEAKRASEVVQATSTDAPEPNPSDAPPNPATIIKKAKEFENEVAAAIAAGKPPFSPSGTLRRNSLLIEKRGPASSSRMVADLIYETDSTRYLIEVKAVHRLSPAIFRQVRALTETYRSFLQERNIDVSVVPVVIAPHDVVLSADRSPDVLVFTFDGARFVGPSLTED